MLAGCGKPMPTGAGLRQGQRLAARNTDAASLAGRFADAVKANFTGGVTVRGAIVTLSFDDGNPSTSYDFTRTPENGHVVVTSEDFSTDVPVEELMKGAATAGTEVLPALLAPIAIQVCTAAAKSLALYYITHRGDDFDKSEAVKVTVVAMGLALIPFVGQVGAVGQLAPVAVKLLASSSSFAYKDLAKAAVGMMDEIVPIVVLLVKKYKDQKAKGERL
jgi:hypothetical protein